MAGCVAPDCAASLAVHTCARHCATSTNPQSLECNVLPDQLLHHATHVVSATLAVVCVIIREAFIVY
jgi:hypothetical protein